MKTKFNKALNDKRTAHVILSVDEKYIFDIDDKEWVKFDKCLMKTFDNLLEINTGNYDIGREINLIGCEIFNPKKIQENFIDMDDFLENKDVLYSKPFKICKINLSRKIEITYDYEIEETIYEN